MAASGAHVAASIASLALFYTLVYSVATGDAALAVKAVQLGATTLLLETYLLARVYIEAVNTPSMGGVARSALIGIIVNAALLGIAYPVVLAGVAVNASRVYRLLESGGVVIDPWPRARILLLLVLWPILAPLLALVASEKLEAMKAIRVYAAAPLGWQGGAGDEGED